MKNELAAQVRVKNSKSYKRTVREKGLIPAVIYGKNIDSVAVLVNTNEFRKILVESGSNALIQMSVEQDGETRKHQVLVKSVQHDPVRRNIIHVDFHQVSLVDKVNAHVPIQLNGEAAGVSKGGVMVWTMRGVDVECLASNIPEAITVDISSLDLGDVVTLGDLVLPPGVKAIGEEHAHVVAINVVRTTDADEPDKEEETSETDGPKESV